MRKLYILTATTAALMSLLSSASHADYSIPLKANAILCSGVNEKADNLKVSLKLATTDENGLYSIEYVIDDQAVAKFESKYALSLTFEGSLYIQTYDESGKVTLTVSGGDIKKLNKDLGSGALTKPAYILDGRFEAAGESFQVSCLGSFVK